MCFDVERFASSYALHQQQQVLTMKHDLTQALRLHLEVAHARMLE